MERGDFDPVVATGTIAKMSGVRAWRKRRDDLPTVEHGRELVVVDRNGEVRGAGALTAGERFWISEGSWLFVDVSDHELHCEFPFTSTDGTAGYSIDVQIMVRVTKPVEAVRRRARSVAAYVTPVLRAELQAALPNPRVSRGADTVSSLNQGRADVEVAVRQRLLTGTERGIDEWLTLRVTDVTVGFDTATKAHHDALVKQTRTSEINVRGFEHGKKEALSQIDLRNTWAAHLADQLSMPATRAVAVAAANPTPENIAVAVDQLNSNDQWTKGEVVSILNKLIDNNFVGDLDELRTIKVIVEGLQRPTSGGAPEIQGSVPGANRVIEAGEMAEPAKPTEAEPGSGSGGDSDRDWS